MIHTMSKRNLGRKGLISNYNLQSFVKGTQGREGPGGRNWSRHHGEMLLTGLVFLDFSACILILSRTFPGMAACSALPTEMDPPIISQLSRQFSHRIANRSIWWRDFLNENLLSPDRSRFVSSQQKPTSTMIKLFRNRKWGWGNSSLWITRSHSFSWVQSKASARILLLLRGCLQLCVAFAVEWIGSYVRQVSCGGESEGVCHLRGLYSGMVMASRKTFLLGWISAFETSLVWL